MIFFPNAKINIGLRVVAERGDGYHDIETAMFPVRGLCDALEIIKNDPEGVVFSSSGLECGCTAEKNLCVKAYETVKEKYDIGGVKIHLHKNIPMGAGLGGGSADAAFVIKGLNEIFGLGLSDDLLEEMAAMNGSDTPFFIRNIPAVATGRGEVLSPVGIDLSGKRLIIVKPDVSVSTASAYSEVVPREHSVPLKELLTQPAGCWRDSIFNDFEKPLFRWIPQLAVIKDTLYDMGAEYVSMSGSGSAIYGIFSDEGEINPSFKGIFTYQEVIV